VVVEGAEADVGFVGDLLDADVGDALAADQGLGGLDQLATRRLSPARVSV
jgi:hypothetical protein